MERQPELPPYIAVVEPQALKVDRMYRAYALPGELVFVWTGKGHELATAIAVQGGLVGGILASATSPSKKNRTRKEELDAKPFAEQRLDHELNFAVRADEMDEAEVTHAGFCYRVNYSIANNGVLRFRHPQRGLVTMAFATIDDAREAVVVLPPALGKKLRVNVEWDETRKRLRRRRA